MPPLRLWLIGLRAAIVAFGGLVVSQFAQLSGTQTSISRAAWVIAIMTGIMAGANAMRDSWPTPAASHHRHRHVPRPPRRVPLSPPD